MNKKLIVKQNGIKDCAVACVLSIIRYYKSEVSRNEIEYLIKTGPNGTNAYNLIEGVKTLGLDGMGKRVNLCNLKDETHNVPFIAHTKTHYGYHYVVVYELNKNNIVLMDPAIGKRKISYDEFDKEFLGTILVFKKTKQIPNLKRKNELFNFLINCVLSKTSTIIKITILTFLITLFTIVISLNMKINIDYIIANNKFNLVYIILILFIIFIILKNILYFIRDKLIRTLEFDLNNKINYKVINHLFNLPYIYFKSRPTGEVISRINDLDYLKSFVYEILLNIFVDILIVLFTFVFISFISLKLTIILLISIIIYFLTSIIYMHIFDKYIMNTRIISSDYQNSLYEYISSFESMKNLNRINYVIDLLDFKYFKNSESITKFKKKVSEELFLKNLNVEIFEIIINFIGVILVMNKMISLGDLISFITLSSFLYTPLRNLMDSFVGYVYSSISYKRINDLLLIKEEDSSTKKDMIDGKITIKDLEVMGSNKKIINNLSLTIEKGEHILIKGKSGCGKSTLLKILRKYITDYNGNILIDNINLKDIDNNSIRNSFLYISQNERLNTMSIKDNILYGRDISKKKYNLVNKLTLTDKLIDKKIFRDNELLEEDGFNISGGERQKIILSRSLHERFNILIIDEALSEVSIEDENKIINNLFSYYNNKTIIYVTHKNGLDDLFDKVIIMEEEYDTK